MRQFTNVSISPWSNPYGSPAINNGQNFYAAPTAPQPPLPLLRRIPPPPPATFSHPDVEQAIDDESSEDDQDDQAGMLGRRYE